MLTRDQIWTVERLRQDPAKVSREVMTETALELARLFGTSRHRVTYGEVIIPDEVATAQDLEVVRVGLFDARPKGSRSRDQAARIAAQEGRIVRVGRLDGHGGIAEEVGRLVLPREEFTAGVAIRNGDHAVRSGLPELVVVPVPGAVPRVGDLETSYWPKDGDTEFYTPRVEPIYAADEEMLEHHYDICMPNADCLPVDQHPELSTVVVALGTVAHGLERAMPSLRF
jgi:hypothetical protein